MTCATSVPLTALSVQVSGIGHRVLACDKGLALVPPTQAMERLKQEMDVNFSVQVL